MWNKRSDCVYVLTKEKCPHLSNHAVPCPINLLAVFAVGDQVQVVSELDRLGDLLQDVNTETFAAALDVNPWITSLIAGKWYREEERGDEVKKREQEKTYQQSEIHVYWGSGGQRTAAGMKLSKSIMKTFMITEIKRTV